MAMIHKAIYKSSATPIKILMVLKNRTKYLQICMESQKTFNTQRNPGVVGAGGTYSQTSNYTTKQQ